MSSRTTVTAHTTPDGLPPLPLTSTHWKAIWLAMRLSPRQAEVAELLARGAQLKAIAESLEITVPTVRTQIERIYSKAGARNRSDFLLRVLDVSHQVDGRKRRH